VPPCSLHQVSALLKISCFVLSFYWSVDTRVALGRLI
jgi:hypothetical protein